MEFPAPAEVPNASFDLVARHDATEAAVESSRGDIADVKARLDRVSRAAARPVIEGAAVAPVSLEVNGFVDGYLRMGRETEIKSLSGTVLADGGYAVPREVDALISARLRNVSPIRAIAQVVQTGTAGYRKLATTGGTASGWVSETAARAESAIPSFAEIAPPAGELYANPAASQAMLDDAAFDIQSWLADEIAMEFARAEGAAFVNGSGNWTWQDGIDAPLVEQAETYLLAYGPPESPLATWTLQSPRMDLPPDLLARLSALAPGAAFSVRQQGTYAVSAALHHFPNPSFRKESPR